MNCNQAYSTFMDIWGSSVRTDEALSAYTTFGTGGKADLYLEVTDTDQLSRVITTARQLSIPYFVIGEGSNLLISDNGYRGLIIRNSIRGREVQGNEIIVGAGETLDKIVDFATDYSLTGLEFAAGIWGTVGGAVYGNAGAFGSQIGSVLKYAYIVDTNGHIHKKANEYFRFDYRYSHLKETGEIVTKICLALHKGDKKAITRRVDEIRETRKGKHPVEPCSAGCFFKNVKDDSQPFGKLAAGKLLDEIGARSMTVGGAGVFPGHANIIVNNGNATSKDIKHLADILKKKVKERFGVELTEEVICLGEF